MIGHFPKVSAKYAGLTVLECGNGRHGKHHTIGEPRELLNE